MICVIIQIVNFFVFPIALIVKWREVSKMRHLKYFLAGLILNMTCTFLIVNYIFLPTFMAMEAPMRRMISENLFPPTEECSCGMKHFHFTNEEHDTPSLISSCSDKDTRYTGNQNVVSFSLHLDAKVDSAQERLYAERITQNLERMRELYPNFKMRIYSNTPAKNGFCKLWCENSDLHWCDVKYTPNLGDKSMLQPELWSSLPLGDPTVALFLARNLQSVITPREAAAVNDWIKLEFPIHLMRDVVDMSDYEILDGFWGANNAILGHKIASDLLDIIIRVYDKLANKSAVELGELNLEEDIFIPQELSVLVHDSYNCLSWSAGAMVRPFPTKRGDKRTDFVGYGNVGVGGMKRQIITCPKQCRPSYAKDWKYC